MLRVLTSALLCLCAPLAFAVNACPQTSGNLTLNVTMPRSSGISPLFVFFDATATTDSATPATSTAFQFVQFAWNFSDPFASGKGRWAYGSHSAYSGKNMATGGIAAHLYITNGSDATYTPIVTATDGTDSVTCSISVTAYDPSGANGFPGTATTCVAAASTPIAGSGGCPSGAAVLQQSNYNTALGSSFGSNKRVLFKCGNTFTGSDRTLTGTKWSIGAYGGCEGTSSGRPIFDTSSTSYGAVMVNYTSTGDGRISDIDCEGAGTGGGCVNTPAGILSYQITLWNLYSNGNHASYAYSQGAQWGLIGLVQTGATGIGTFMNYNENNPPYTGHTINNLDYQALIGSHITGVGCCGTGAGVETVRVSACRLCVLSNNTIQDANNVGAVLKFHNGNTNNSVSTWSGIYNEYDEISDNLFTGNSGAQLVEIAPQNAGDDERLRYLVVERNIFAPTTGASDGRELLATGVNQTIRNNVFYIPAAHANAPIYGVQVARRGIEPTPQYDEVYNNTCYFLKNQSPQNCIGFDNINMSAAAINSIAKNNLFYDSASGHSTVVNNGTGNTVSNNTSTTTSNPSIINGSGAFDLISDFKPTANYSGGASVPNLYDALGVPWSPTWDLGAVHH